MSDTDSPVHVFTVRGRPVGFQSSRFGGSLHAQERGYFPISPTGYRSLAGHFGTGPAAVVDIPAEFLEKLAEADDRDRRTLLAQLARAPRAESDGLGNFIHVSGRASAAVQAALFAPADERVALWCGAFRLLSLIDSDRRFQPAPNGTAWTAEACAKSLATQRAMLAYVRRIATGDHTQRPPGLFIGVSAYFELPPRPEIETPFALPALTGEFALDLPPSPDWRDDDEDEPEAVLVTRHESGGEPDEDSAQLDLF
ncbi:MAG TPA: hypothetical protein VG838_13555 [Opitutaceae bacterium]|nr:hypothetical protein [Lacunisphaera sp.]HWA10467.1 hypothetical protein [Opitutaceae bacterium]